MKIQIRESATGRVHDVSIAEIERAHAALRAPRPGAPLHLADVADLPLAERMRRAEEAVAVQWPLAYKDGGVDPESYTRVIDVFDREVVFRRGSKTYSVGYRFNADLSVTFNGSPTEVIVSYERVDGDNADVDDDDATLAAADVRGADARWNRAIATIKREQGVNDRQAGEILALREPALWDARRSELAGMRLPRIRQRHNRHFINDGE